MFVVALVPRLANLNQHATADEDLTVIRSANVALALERDDWWSTYQIGHPEATVQLLVALGLGADALRPFAGDFLGAEGRIAAATPGYFATLVKARTLLAPVHAGLVVLAALLGWRLWGAVAGVALGLLLGLEPFLVAHGRILRTDALLSELLVVAILAALAFWSRRAGVWALAICIASTALALLTKTPAFALLGAVPAAALAGALTADLPASSPLASRPSPLATLSALGSRLAVGLTVWLLGTAALFAALWPAMWVRPLRALERMVVYTQEKGGSPMDAGSYFLGAPIADPGPLYYALALPLRLSPILLLGLALWAILGAPFARRGVGVTLMIGIGLAVALAVLPKKADRYILPVIPFLAVVAAVGIAALAARWRRAGMAGALVTIVLMESMLLLAVWPYPLAAYNPLLGGARTANAWISVGWGEGLDQLAPALNARPNAASLTVSTPYPEVLQAQIVGRAVDLDAPDVAQYAVRYVAADQRHLTSAALDAALAGRQPIQRVEIAGVPYAELYELDRASFAGDLLVSGLAVSQRETGRRSTVTVTLTLGPASTAPVEVGVALVNSANPSDVEATATAVVTPNGSPAEIKVRTPNSLGRYLVGVSVREPNGGPQRAVTVWPVGSPRLPDRMVFPSLSVRVQ